VCDLLYGGVSIWNTQGHIVGWLIINKLEGIWKEAIVGLIEAVSRNFPGGTEGNHEIPQAG
jgi:hypothetical protein